MANNLSGKKEIRDYTRRSWPIIMRWIKKSGFPARKIGGIWESDIRLIDEWKMEQIKNPVSRV
jgi:hypothetical protein